MSQKRSGDPEIGKTLITLSKLLKARNFYVHIKPDQRYTYYLQSTSTYSDSPPLLCDKRSISMKQPCMSVRQHVDAWEDT